MLSIAVSKVSPKRARSLSASVSGIVSKSCGRRSLPD